MLDTSVLPAQFPAPNGLSEDGLMDLLHDVATSCELIGAEITGLTDPDLAGLAASIVRWRWQPSCCITEETEYMATEPARRSCVRWSRTFRRAARPPSSAAARSASRASTSGAS